jgi:predicted transcriptional regulator
MVNKVEKLLEDIRNLLILQLTKEKVTQAEVGKCLGVKNTRINNIILGVGKKKDGKE